MKKIYKCPKKAILASESGFAEFLAEKTFDIPLLFRVYGGINDKYWLIWWVKDKNWSTCPAPFSYDELIKFSDAKHYKPVDIQNLKIEEVNKTSDTAFELVE